MNGYNYRFLFRNFSKKMYLIVKKHDVINIEGTLACKEKTEHYKRSLQTTTTNYLCFLLFGDLTKKKILAEKQQNVSQTQG